MLNRFPFMICPEEELKGNLFPLDDLFLKASGGTLSKSLGRPRSSGSLEVVSLMMRLMLSALPLSMMGRKRSSVSESFRCILEPSVLDRVRTMTEAGQRRREGQGGPFSADGRDG
jgi:hypothetical protein